MTSVVDPADWERIIPLLAEGDYDALRRTMQARDNRLYSYFEIFDNSSYTPTLWRGTSQLSITPASTTVQGLRVGPFVLLSVSVKAAEESDGTGLVMLSLPPQLPCVEGMAPSGVFLAEMNAGLGKRRFSGTTTVTTANRIYGHATGQALGIGNDTNTSGAALEVGYAVGFSVQYLTTLAAIL